MLVRSGNASHWRHIPSCVFPITLGLYEWNGQAARIPLLQESVITGALVSIVPVIIVYILLQRFWRTGLAAGSVK